MHQPIDSEDFSDRDIEILSVLFEEAKANKRGSLVGRAFDLGIKIADLMYPKSKGAFYSSMNPGRN